MIDSSPFNNRYSRRAVIHFLIVGFLTAFCFSSVAGADSNSSTDARDLTLSLSHDPLFYQPLAGYVAYYIDESLQQDIESLIGNPSAFKPFHGSTIGFSVTANRVWLKVQLENATDKAGLWRIDFNRMYYKELDVFVQRDGEPPQRIFQHRDTDHFNQRPPDTRLLGENIYLSSGELATLFIAYRSGNTTYMPVAIGSLKAVQTIHAQDERVDWLLNGALLAMVFFALIMLPAIGLSLALSFCGYLLAGTFFVLHAEGYTTAYLWPSFVYLSDPIHMSAMMFVPVLGLLFASNLFNFAETAPRFYTLIKMYSALAMLVAGTSVFITENLTLTVMAYYVAPLGSVLQLASGIIASRQRLLGWLPYLIGTLIVISPFLYAVSAHLLPFEFNLKATLDFSHFSLVTEGLAFAFAITLRMLGLKQDRDKALTAELVATKQQLQLSSDLQQSQKDYIEAHKLSEIRKAQLRHVSHDLQAPLASLRNAISTLANKEGDRVEAMQHAFDYLENLATEQINPSRQTPKPPGDLERFPVSVVMDNVYTMFDQEASERDIEFCYQPIDAQVLTDPLALMRILSNLVSNALKHSRAQQVNLTASESADSIKIEVRDDGVGIPPELLMEVTKEAVKRADSDGAGLGLAIVHQLADKLKMGLELRSTNGQGTVATLTLATD